MPEMDLGLLSLLLVPLVVSACLSCLRLHSQKDASPAPLIFPPEIVP